MRVFLAGDSLVQDYTDEEFIAGWGQFLKQAVSKDCEVINMAKGGRSSRLFINEGRFDEIDKNIQKGDYLFIEFCHNDDNSKGYKTMFNRLVSTGKADENGRYPLIPGELVDKTYIPEEYLKQLYADESIKDKQAVIDSVLNMFKQYPHDKYYPYSEDGSKGTYKWFLKQYVDMAREHEAVPVIVTAVARTVFDDNGKLKDGAGLHGGDNFCYIRAARQLASECNAVLLDLFEASKTLFEKVGKENIHYLMSIKQGINKGKWPEDFDKEMLKKETVSEDTHLNKYGAYLITNELVRLIMDCNNRELDALKKNMTGTIQPVEPPEKLQLK